jgi:hypothetical protein
MMLSILLSIFLNYEILNTPARAWLENTYLPSLSGNILYVGVGSYTQKYHQLTKTPRRFVTLDYDIDKACFGSPFRHYSEDFLTFQTNRPFEHVSLFGVMGHPPTVTTSKYTIIDDGTISQAIQQADHLVKTGGTLLLGPNHKDFPGQDAQFWIHQFSKAPLDKYEIIYCATFCDNIVWWGRKVRE